MAYQTHYDFSATNQASITAQVDDTQNGALAFAVAERTWWQLNTASVAPLGPTVLATVSAVGRWLLVVISSYGVTLSFPNIAALAAYDSTADVEGQFAYVVTMDDYYSLLKTGGLTADAINIVNGLPAGAQWQRRLIASEKWLSQATWFVSPATGNDENSGLTATPGPTGPLATLGEFQKRCGASAGQIKQTTVVTVLDAPVMAPFENVVVDVETVNTSTYVRITGARTTLYTGTLSFVQAESPLTCAQNLVRDASLATDWVTAGAVAGGLFSAAYRTGKMIEMLDGPAAGAIAWAQAQSPTPAAPDPKELSLSPWIKYPATYIPVGLTTPLPVAGNTYLIRTIPTLGGEVSFLCRNRPIVVENLILSNLGAGFGFTPVSAFFLYACELTGASAGPNIFSAACSVSSIVGCKVNLNASTALYAEWEPSGCLFTGPGAVVVSAAGNLSFVTIPSSCQGNGVAGIVPTPDSVTGRFNTTTGVCCLRSLEGGVVDLATTSVSVWNIGTGLLVRAGGLANLRRRLWGTVVSNGNCIKVDSGGQVYYSNTVTSQPRFSPTPGPFGGAWDVFPSGTSLLNMESMGMLGGISPPVGANVPVVFPTPVTPFFAGRQTGTATLVAGTVTVTASVNANSSLSFNRIDTGAGITGTSLDAPSAGRTNNSNASALGSFVITDKDITGATIVTSVSTVAWELRDPRSSSFVPSQAF